MAEAQFNLVNCIKSAFYVHTQKIYASEKKFHCINLGNILNYIFMSLQVGTIACSRVSNNQHHYKQQRWYDNKREVNFLLYSSKRIKKFSIKMAKLKDGKVCLMKPN